jgi:chemotaxis protein methyltransferase CheR
LSAQAMRADIGHSEVERFRAAIVRQIGLQFDDDKLVLLREVLCRRLNRLSCSSTSYLGRLEEEKTDRDELCALAQELTVGETYFFRHNDQFRALADVALPQRMRARGSARTLRLLSAGCASGEEAYSLAIVARETIADPSWNVVIRAIDLNPNVLAKAARARYSPWAMREAPADLQRKWFRSENRELIVDETIRTAVSFDKRNLAGNDPELWQPSAFDVIFCRNVLMYFSPDQMRAAIVRMAESLAPGGYLFLGHAETLRGISDDFRLCHTHDTFYYQRENEVAPALRQKSCIITPAAPVKSSALSPAIALSTAWVDAIRQASERVAALVPATYAGSAKTQPHSSCWELAPIFELLRDERLCDALDYVRNGPPHAANNPNVLLIEAVLLAQSGQVEIAEDICRRLLLIDQLNAGAHYVMALCREHAGEGARAREHDRLAAHLDPTFAMPHLHCGLLARRAGDRETGRRELAQAQLLLRREDVSRLLLFGGGFSRDALIALCQSAAMECGGRP